MIKRIHRWGEKLDNLHEQMDNHMTTHIDVKFLSMFHSNSKLADIQNITLIIKDSI